MRIAILRAAICLLIFYSNAFASENYERAVFDASVSIIKELNYMKALENKTIAVMGFDDIDKELGCPPFSVAIANQIDSDINKIKSLLNVNFKTVPRHSLDSIETEYSISHGGIDSDIFNKLKSPDILITGFWQDQGDSLKLTIKAVSMKKNEIEQLNATSININKNTLPKNHLNCFRDTVEVVPSNDSQPVEKIGAGELDWNDKILRVKGYGTANKNFPRNLWKRTAEEVAVVDAQTKMMEMVNGFHLESTTFIKNYQLEKDEKIKEIKGKLKNIKQVGKTMFPTEDTAEVVLELNLKSVFLK